MEPETPWNVQVRDCNDSLQPLQPYPSCPLTTGRNICMCALRSGQQPAGRCPAPVTRTCSQPLTPVPARPRTTAGIHTRS